MAKEIIPFTSEQEWRDARAHDVTSTESAALFNASPYTTAFELYYAKQMHVIEQRADNARMRWGRRLQEPIARGVADDHKLDVEPMREYIREPDARLGSSFDYRITGVRGHGQKNDVAARLLTKGPGLMEIKTVDPFEFKANWHVVDGEVIEAPPHIELQVQHQMLVSGLQWALIVALVGGNRVSVIERDYDETLCRAIVAKVREFWTLVDQGTPPAPDYTRDAELISRQYLATTAGKIIDARDDALLADWVKAYQLAGVEERLLGGKRQALRAQILERIGDAARVNLPDYGTLVASTVRETTVPEYTRAAFRTLRYYPRKEIVS